MKIIFSVILLLTLNVISEAQAKRDLSHEGMLDYALISEGVFYVPFRSDFFMRSSIIRAKQMDSVSIAVRHVSFDSFSAKHPFSWSKSEESLFSIYCFMVNNVWGFNIGHRTFEKRDTVEVARAPKEEIHNKSITVAPLVRYERAHLYSPFMYEREKLREVILGLSFDIRALSKDELKFFLRDSAALYVWSAEIELTGRTAEWKEHAVYGSPQFDTLSAPMQNPDFYSGQNTHFNAITDTLFFDGHFKVIEQDGENYIINREHAIIYHMGKKKITPVGRVLVTNDYPKIQGKPLFIEDRDNNRLIFFAPVQWEDTDLPKPNAYYMKEDEMREYFKYVMD